jgi:hypothetical protein
MRTWGNVVELIKVFLKKGVGNFFSFFLDVVWMHIGCAVAQDYGAEPYQC